MPRYVPNEDEPRRDYPRNEWLLELYGEAQAVRSIERTLSNRMQYTALHNQFKSVDVSKEEITEIKYHLREIGSSVAKLMDLVTDMYHNNSEEEEDA